MKHAEIFKGKPYLSLETRRKNGESVPTPVWFVQDREAFFVRTITNSGKVKRIHNDPHVRIAVCSRDGELLSDWVEGLASEILDNPEIAENVDSLLEEKYGEMKRILAAQTAQAGYTYTVLKIIIDEK